MKGKARRGKERKRSDPVSFGRVPLCDEDGLKEGRKEGREKGGPAFERLPPIRYSAM